MPLSKRNKIIYWIATLWLALGMTSTGIVQILNVKEEVDMIVNLGYPIYIITLLGIWKILGVIAILIPRFPLVKEWAYAGFAFTMMGALFSHVVMEGGLSELAPPSLLLVLTIVSWYFRPADRKTLSTS